MDGWNSERERGMDGWIWRLMDEWVYGWIGQYGKMGG